MKKILSSVLAAATLASVMVFPATAEGEAPKSVTQEIDVLYMSTQPTFDGDITAEEWGEKSFTVTGATAAKPGDTAPSAANTFAWYEHVYDEIGKTITSEDEVNKKRVLEQLTYDIWLRWDTKYLYIAAKVNDPDGYYLPAGRERIWDGDCVQFRVDPMGPNGYLSYKDPSYDYKTEGFDTTKTEYSSHTPWAYRTKICNIGLGAVNGDTTNSRNVQAYDMADNGTGDMTKQQLLNDPNKLGPNVNPLGDENDYASLFNMKITDNGDGTCVNTYECAVPWVFLDQWGLGQVAVGYVWGMSIVVLDGYDDGDSNTAPFGSWLTWGSGICGDQMDKAYLRPTIGGSNGIILSDEDALTGETVEGLPQVVLPTPYDEVTYNIIDATGMSAYYLGSSASAVDGDFEISWDIAYLGEDPINPDRTWVGALLGDGYGMAAGWEADTKKFFVGENHWSNGVNTDENVPYAQSEIEFDWPVGEWHRLGIKVVDDTVTVTFDGEVVLEDTDKRNTCISLTTTYEMVIYNIGNYVYDNYKIVTGDEVIADFTCDSDDVEFNKSDFKLNALPMAHEFVEGKCQKACELTEDPNDTSEYGCLMHPDVDADGNPVMKCDFCGTVEAASVVYGDVTGEGSVNLSDVSKLLQFIAKWEGVDVDTVAADVNCDNSINLSDVSKMLQFIAKWEGIVLGPQA